MTTLPANALKLPWLQQDEPLPPAHRAWPAHAPYPGLLAAGGDLSVSRLVHAYRNGIFPWFNEGEPILWWSTDPRMALQPDAFKLHPSLRKQLASLLKTRRLRIDIDTNFDAVIAQCAQSVRPGQNGTWIGPDMQHAYYALFEAGHAHCVTAWIDGVCAGGLYGVNIGRMVFGESMFSLQSNGSKIALAALVALCRREQFALIDCQQVTSHLASLGAQPLSRAAFLDIAQPACEQPKPNWTFESIDWQHLDERLA